MRCVNHQIPVIDGWLTLAQCHGCADLVGAYLALENNAGFVMILCKVCILAIAEYAVAEFTPPASRA